MKGKGKSNATVNLKFRGISSLAFFAAAALILIFGLTSCTSTQNPAISAGTQNLEDQAFTIDANSNEVIMGQNGSYFAIPAGAFLDANGNKVYGEIEVKLTEANSPRDILMGGLVTRTGNEMLASDGMYKIDASRNGESLTLNPEVGIYAYLPADGIDPDMGLYAGEFDASKLDWRLTGQEQEGLLDLADADVKKKCKRCKNLAKMAKNITTGPKPGENEYYVKRHYWENGVLYFASSGSAQPILSKKLLEECDEYLKSTGQGKELLAKIDELKAQQQREAGAYYRFRITNMGWYNIDKLVKDELITFTGRVIDKKGNPVNGAEVHLLCTDPDNRIHSTTTAENGEFSLKFIPGKEFRIYAFQEDQVGKQAITVRLDGEKVDPLAIAPVTQDEMDTFLSDLM